MLHGMDHKPAPRNHHVLENQIWPAQAHGYAAANCMFTSGRAGRHTTVEGAAAQVTMHLPDPTVTT